MTSAATTPWSSIFTRIQRQMAMLPKTLPEESLLLRVLVQSMVVVGIIATDIAAETQLSLWAISLQVCGRLQSCKPDLRMMSPFFIAFCGILSCFYNFQAQFFFSCETL